jgi:hypothetical protein
MGAILQGIVYSGRFLSTSKQQNFYITSIIFMLWQTAYFKAAGGYRKDCLTYSSKSRALVIEKNYVSPIPSPKTGYLFY